MHAMVFFSTYNRPSTSTRRWNVARGSMTQNLRLMALRLHGFTELFGTHFIIKQPRHVAAVTATREMIAAR
jgi:hypothetical protein